MKGKKVPGHSVAGIIGMFIHTLNDEGDIHNQGCIIGQHGDSFLVQRFSFLDGSRTDVLPIPISRVMALEKCLLYATNADMVIALCTKNYRSGQGIGSLDDQIDFALRDIPGTKQHAEALEHGGSS